MANIGILAIQGGYQAHIDKLNQLGAKTTKITSSKELSKISALIIPGGESSVFLKLLDSDFKTKLIKLDIPTLSTCAGIILLSKKVYNPSQESLGLLDLEVERNAYGRQLQSFKSKNLIWQESKQIADFEGIFIRAPKITSTGQNVKTLHKHNEDPVLVKQDKHLAATFHPELCKKDSSIHEMFLSSI